jgi:hypothetical protein
MLDKIRKRQNEAIKRKKKTVIENIHMLGKLPGIDVAFSIRQNKSGLTLTSSISMLAMTVYSYPKRVEPQQLPIEVFRICFPGISA